MCFVAPPGDREKEVPAPSTGTLPNSYCPPSLLPIIPITNMEPKRSSEVVRIEPVVTNDGYDDHSKGQPLPNNTWRPDTCRVLLLCGGLDDRPNSLSNLFKTMGSFECTNYDTANGPQFDIVDDSVWDTLYSEATSMEYAGCVACPPCGSYSKLHSLPGPPTSSRRVGPGSIWKIGPLSPLKRESAQAHADFNSCSARVISLHAA